MGQNISSCGTEKSPCKDLTYALTEYHKQTGKPWMFCIKIHIDSPQKLKSLNNTGLSGFGNPSYKRGQHTNVQILTWKTSIMYNNHISISIHAIDFEHVKLSMTGIDLIITNCTFMDSSLVVGNTHSVDIMGCKWKHTSNITLLDITNADNMSNVDCEITDTMLKHTNTTRDVVHLQNLKNVILNQMVIEKVNMSIDRILYPQDHIFGVVKVVNCSNTNLRGLNINHSTLRDKYIGVYTNDYSEASLSLVDSQVNISRSTFAHTKGQALFAIRCDLQIYQSNFTSNIYSYPLHSGGGAAMSTQGSNVSIDRSLFAFNEGFTVRHGMVDGFGGGAIYVANGSMMVKNSIFRNNSQQNDGGAAICSQNNTLRIHNSIFTFNTAWGDGGALKVTNPYMNDICQMVGTDKCLQIYNCTFSNNQGVGMGGAIFLQGIRDSASRYGLFNGCIFNHNIADEGGAVSLMDSNINMEGCKFRSNSARVQGGAVYCLKLEFHISKSTFRENTAQNYGASILANDCFTRLASVSFTSKKVCEGGDNKLPLIYLSDSPIFLTDVIMEIDTGNYYKQYFDIFIHFGSVSGAKIDYKGFSFICPSNYQAGFRTFGGGTGNVSLAPCAAFGTSCFDFTFSCILVESGYYILGKSALHGVNQHVWYEGNEIKTCPIPGGNCTQGLRPLDGFWGPYVMNGTAHFMKCAQELCCTGSDCEGNTSCNSKNNRAGILCTNCKTGYSESLFAEKCVSNKKCKSVWPLVVVPILVITIVIFSIFFGVQKYITKFYGLISTMLKGLHGELKAITKPESQGQSGTNRQAQDPPCNMTGAQNPDHERNQSHPSTSSATKNQTGSSNSMEPEYSNNWAQPGKHISAILLAVFTIFYYTQDVTLYHVDLAPYEPFWVVNAKMIQNIFNLQSQILGAIDDETCVFKSISPVGKILLNISVYPLIYVTFLSTYITVFKLIPLINRCNFCITLNQKITENSIKIKTNLATGFLIVAMLSYQSITKAALQMVKCVEVYDTVLLVDSNTKCYKWWQYMTWIYILACSIPFPIYLIFRPHGLRNQSVSVHAFLIGLILPGPFTIWWLVRYINIGNFGNGQNEPSGINERNPPPSDQTTGDAPLLDHENQNEMGDHAIREILADNLEGGYKVYLNGWLNWAGIILFLRLILVFLSIFVQATLTRILSMLALSIFSLVLHTAVRPCVKPALNILLILSQAAIVSVGICYLILATLQRNQYQPPEKDPITSGLQIVIYIFSVLIPVSCVIILTIDFLFRIIITLGLLFIKGTRKAYMIPY